MFATIRRHQKWLLAVIITVVIIAFVLLFSPDVQLMPRGDQPNFGYIKGQPIDQEEFRNAYAETRLELLFQFGQELTPTQMERFGINLEDRARSRLLLIKLLNEYKIEVGNKTLVQEIAQLPFLQDEQTGKFSPQQYDQFLNFLRANKMTEQDFSRFMKHRLAMRQLASVFGLSGKLMPPRAVKPDFLWENQQLQVMAVTFASSNYLSRVAADPAELSRYYTNQGSLYRIPERIVVHYVRFPATNYLEEAESALSSQEDLEEQIENEYLSRGTNSFRNAEGDVMPPEEAKDQIREEQLEERALLIAKRKAAEFATELYNLQEEEPRSGDFLAQFASSKDLEAQATEPFSRQEGPPNLDVGSNFAQAAFNLTQEMPFSRPLEGDSAVYVLGLSHRIPSELPPLEEVREKVVEDFKESKASQLAFEAGRSFYSSMTNRLASGQSFETTAQESNLEAISLPKFSLSDQTRPSGWDNRVEFSMLKNSVRDLEVGDTTRFLPTRNGGFIAYLESREDPLQELVNEEFPAYLEEKRLQRQNQAFSAWLSKKREELQLTGPPEAQQEVPGNTGPPAAGN